MLSVERIAETVYTKPATPIFSRDINSNMIGASIVGDAKSTKRSSGNKLLDNETLLVILNTVLNTQYTTSTTNASQVTKHSHTSHTQSHSHTSGSKTSGSERMVPGTQ